MIKNKRFMFLLLSPLLLAACWDKVEVEERGFVSGIAIDLANSASKMDINEQDQPREQDNTQLQPDKIILNQHPDEDYGQNKNSKFKLTQQLIVPSGLGQAQNSGGNTTPAFRNLSQTGDTII